MTKVYDNYLSVERIDEVWEIYHKSKDRKERAELRKEYRQLAKEDEKRTGMKRYKKI